MTKSRRIAQISIFSAVIIVLQILATFINIGSFPITLTLIPIIVGACVYGEKVGGFLGLVFGLVVFVMVITGADPNSLIMFNQNPLATTAVIFIKGFLCGYASGLVYKLLHEKNNKLAIILASVVCPIVNTSIFLIFLILFFDGTIKVFISAFLSFNFVLELLTNVLLAPGINKLISLNRSKNNI